MANTFGQSKANDESAWQNNKELNPQVNSSVTDDENDSDKHENSWRPTDETLESPVSSEFDDAESAKRRENTKSETPGLHPDIAG